MRRTRPARLIIGVICVLGIIAYGIAFVSRCRTDLFATTHFKATFIGLITGAAIWIVLGRKLAFFSVFEHEFTHLFFSIIMFQKPSSFYASRRRGHVSCDRGNFVDGLAPYYFPTFSYLLLALYPLLRPSAHAVFFPVLGLTTGYHVVSNIGEFRPSESDIRRYGVLFSFVFCLFIGILTLGFLLGFVTGGYGGGIGFVKDGWHQAMGVMAYLVGSIWNTISRLFSSM